MSRDAEEATVGHNSMTKAARDKLKQIVESIERLEEERAGISTDIRERYAEAKSMGYDSKALRAVIQIRKKDKTAHEEFEQIRDLYLLALGDI